MKREDEREHQLAVPSVSAQRSGWAGQMPPVSWIETNHNKPIRNKNKLDAGRGATEGFRLGSIKSTAIRHDLVIHYYHYP